MAFQNKFTIGLHNWELYYKVSRKETWLCILNSKKEIISYNTYNVMPNDVIYGHHILVREDYWDQKITREYGFYGLKFIGSSTAMSILRYGFKTYDFKLLGFFGFCRKELLTSPKDVAKVNFATKSDLGDILDYDRSICKLDRSDFITEWTTDDRYSTTCIARDGNNRCVGFGTVREFWSYHGLVPVYAENDEIASQIFHALASLVDKKMIYIFCTAHSRASLQFAKQMNLAVVDTEMRCYMSQQPQMLEYARSLPYDKCFSMTEFYAV